MEQFMKVTVPDSVTCPKCGGVFRVFQSPWPHTGELLLYNPPFCPHCGERLKGEKKR